MRFTKMEGLGNDYIYLDCMSWEPEDLPGLAVRLSDRHFGPGADGLICVKPGQYGDFTMEMYNADGSRGAMCGNGIRCLGKYVYDRGLTRKRCLTIDTDAGPRALELTVQAGVVSAVTVDMGAATLLPPVRASWEGEELVVYPVLVGNPHAVVFCANPDDYPLERLGPVLECHPALGKRSNVELVSVTGEDSLKIRVWERGSGITLACGTGACAAFAAARKAKLCSRLVTARLPGGELLLEEKNGSIYLTGPATTVYDGETSR